MSFKMPQQITELCKKYKNPPVAGKETIVAGQPSGAVSIVTLRNDLTNAGRSLELQPFYAGLQQYLTELITNNQHFISRQDAVRMLVDGAPNVAAALETKRLAPLEKAFFEEYASDFADISEPEK